MTVDKDQLLQPRLPEEEVEIPGQGTVRIRALSRAEVVDHLRKVDRDVPGAFECRLISMSLVGPEMTEDEVRQWRKASQAEEIEALYDAINGMSSLTKQSAKDEYKEFESDPDAEFRVLPSGEAVDDGGPDAGGDAEL